MYYSCPVCAGRGTVSAGFYHRAGATTDATPEPCRACGARGVLWGLTATLPAGPVTVGPPVRTDVLELRGGGTTYRCPTCGGPGGCGHVQFYSWSSGLA